MIIDGHAHIGTASKFYAFKVRTVEKTIEAMDTAGVEGRTRKRSKYGAKKNK